MTFSSRMILSTLILFLLAIGSVSAKTLTLDDCIELALKNHYDIVRAKGNMKMADGALWNAFGSFLPSVSAEGSVTQSNSSLELAKSYTLGAGAGLTVFNGGRNIFNYLGAKTDKAYYEYIAEQSEQGLKLTVKRYYFAYLAAEKTREIQAEALKGGEERHKLAKSRYEVGAASKSDVLKSIVRYGTDKLDLIDAENNVKKALANIAYLIGIDVDSDVGISTDFVDLEYQGTEIDALKYGLNHFPGLLASEKFLSSAGYGVKSAWGAYLPSISVRVSRSYGHQFWHEVKSLDSDYGQWGISTTLSIPIFSNFSRKYNMSSAKANLNNARAGYSYEKNNVALRIKTAFLDMTKANEKLNVAGENENAAAEDMALVQEKYNLGAATMLELLDAQVSLITAQNSRIQSEFDYNLAVAKLENAMGVK